MVISLQNELQKFGSQQKRVVPKNSIITDLPQIVRGYSKNGFTNPVILGFEFWGWYWGVALTFRSLKWFDAATRMKQKLALIRTRKTRQLQQQQQKQQTTTNGPTTTTTPAASNNSNNKCHNNNQQQVDNELAREVASLRCRDLQQQSRRRELLSTERQGTAETLIQNKTTEKEEEFENGRMFERGAELSETTTSLDRETTATDVEQQQQQFSPLQPVPTTTTIWTPTTTADDITTTNAHNNNNLTTTNSEQKQQGKQQQPQQLLEGRHEATCSSALFEQQQQEQGGGQVGEETTTATTTNGQTEQTPHTKTPEPRQRHEAPGEDTTNKRVKRRINKSQNRGK